ncbi:ABC transporter ATP-binding protein [Campylobacter mucosalis]|uniref:ABC transporter ATP-binding protein n=1 Tax=Campylobacter mucosalis TaxID=202 RepID=UPI001470692B|nr:ABC transporter ATP-binding protein [Campylobacter mucosalis]
MAKFEVKNGFFSYKDNQILKDFNFYCKNAEITAILGLNGQGKSTILKLMLNILKFDKAQILSDATFSYLPQNFITAYDFTVKDIVLMGIVSKISLLKAPSVKDEEQVLQILDSLGLKAFANRNFSTLSGGQKQLVLFARAIFSKSDIMLLDEPMSELDLKNQNRVLKLLKELKSQNFGIVFSTHDPNHVLKIADNTLILFSDKSYIFGKTDEILSSDNLTKLYSLEFLKFSDILAPKFSF